MPLGRKGGQKIDLGTFGLEEDEGAIPPNLRPLAIVEAVAQAGVPVTPTQVNQTLGLPKQTLHRLFQTLEEEGYLQRSHDGRSYSPGRRLNRMAVDVVSSERIRMVRLAVLKGLADKIGETCNIALPDRDAMVYLDRVETEWPLRIQLPVGTRVPFHATASGKLFLSTLDSRRLSAWLSASTLEQRTESTLTDPDAIRAEMSAIRERGYSTDNEEFMEGMVALAVPIYDRQEETPRLVSTLSFHAPTLRMSIDATLDWLDVLRASATDLESLLER